MPYFLKCQYKYENNAQRWLVFNGHYGRYSMAAMGSTLGTFEVAKATNEYINTNSS